MTHWPAVEFLQRLLEEREFDKAGTRLIPCIHDELLEDVGLLHAAAVRYAGTFFQLSALDEDWEDPPGPIAPDRLAYVQGVLSSSAGALPGVILFEEKDKRVIASVKGAKDNPTEPSLKVILRAAAVVVSGAMDEFELMIVCATTEANDPSRKELLWRILTAPPEDLAVVGNKTVVAIFDGPLDPDIDYGRVPEVRYVVRSDRVLKRSKDTQDGAIRSIAGHDRPIVLFLGAGASASSHIPLGNSYRSLALQQLLGKDGSDEPGLEDLFFEYLHDRDRFFAGESANRAEFLAKLTLERVLRETFHELGFQPRRTSPVIAEIAADCQEALGYARPGRLAIRELAKQLKGRLILATVNFDQLIETDLGIPSNVLFTPQQFKDGLEEVSTYLRGADSPVPILKLHGSIEDPDSLIATIDTTSAGLHGDVRSVLDLLLAECDGPLTWAWIGCSMRDKDINAWLRGLRGDALDEWWVDPLPGQSIDDFFQEHRAPFWQQQGRRLSDRLIVESADRFLERLADHVLTR